MTPHHIYSDTPEHDKFKVHGKPGITYVIYHAEDLRLLTACTSSCSLYKIHIQIVPYTVMRGAGVVVVMNTDNSSKNFSTTLL